MRLHLGTTWRTLAGVRDSEPGFAWDRCVIVRYWRRYSNSVEIQPKPRRDSALDSCMNTPDRLHCTPSREALRHSKETAPLPFCRMTPGCKLFDSSRQYRGRLYVVIQLIEG